jgi:hypothetical protein
MINGGDRYRQGKQKQEMRVEVPCTRKTLGKTLIANDNELALAA